MSAMTIPADGGCRCSKLRFRITMPPLFTAICHCSGCQRMSGSAFSTTVSVPSNGFAVTDGTAVIGGLHGSQARHHHCDYCMSWVFTRIEPDMRFVNVRATMLDNTAWFTPFIQTYTAEALSWAITATPYSYPAFPPMEDFQKIVGEFATLPVRTRAPEAEG